MSARSIMTKANPSSTAIPLQHPTVRPPSVTVCTLVFAIPHSWIYGNMSPGYFVVKIRFYCFKYPSNLSKRIIH
jgi:hypothetical protein